MSKAVDLLPIAKRVACVLALALACSTGADSSTASIIRSQHVFVVDGEGRPVDPRTLDRFECLRGSAPHQCPSEDHVDRILDGVRQYTSERWRQGKEARVVVFVHGGLNTYQAAVARAEQAGPLMIEDGVYPIFIVWSSNLWVSLLDQTFSIRQGRAHGKVVGWTSWPFFLASSLGSGVARLPVTWFHQVKEDFSTVSPRVSGEQMNTKAIYLRLASLYQDERNELDDADSDRTQLAVSWDHEDGYSTLTRIGRFFMYARTLPTKFATSPLITGLGRDAWDNMRRRSRTVFHAPDEFNLGEKRGDSDIEEWLGASPTGSGALARFLDRVETEFALLQTEVTEKTPLRISIIGHSMGTIVLNEVLRDWPAIPVRDVVYMGAACTVRDFQLSVLPYLETNPRASFYNLCLSPVNERREINKADIPHRGSLLNWIDSFYSNPATHPERTLGKWENTMQAAHLIPKAVRGQVTLKAFGTGRVVGDRRERGTATDNAGPQKHGEFSDFEFWKEDFWTPHAPNAIDPPPEWGWMARGGWEWASLANEHRPWLDLGLDLTVNRIFAAGLHAKKLLGNAPAVEVSPDVWKDTNAFLLGLDIDHIEHTLTTDTFIGLGWNWIDGDLDRRNLMLVVEPAMAWSPWGWRSLRLTAEAGYRFDWVLGHEEIDLDGFQGWTGRVSIRWGGLEPSG